MRLMKRVFWILVLLVAISFAAMNMQTVEVTVLPFAVTDTSVTSFAMPLAFVIFVSLLVGLLVGVMLEHDRERPIRRERTEKSRELAKTRNELAQLQSALKQSDTPETAALLLPRR